jgi:hypothetical protein
MANSPLQQILDLLGRPAAAAFIEEQVGLLLAFDRDHGSQLGDELERALDAFGVVPEVGQCRIDSPGAVQAIRLLGLDLDDADKRLAVHCALKLGRLLSS